MIWSLTIVARWHGRRTPVYLASWSEDEHGTEDHDAFHTLADAKRWLLSVAGRKRGEWETFESTLRPGQPAIWRLDIEEAR